MTKFQRIRAVSNSLLSILSAVLLMASPETGALIIITVLCFALAIKGINRVLFYFSMARHMVDGEMQLVHGLLFLMLSLTILSLTDVPVQYIMIYLLAIYGFNGAISILRANEAKHLNSPGWKLSMLQAVWDIGVCLLCIICFGSFSIMVYIYGVTQIISAINRLISATKRSAMIYIQ